MAKNKPDEANNAFSQKIQKALSVLCKSTQWRVFNHPKKGESVRLYALPSEILKDRIASFEDKKALYEFHWHPEKIDRLTLEPATRNSTDKEPFPHPHLHVRAADRRFDNLNKKHIPSGRVALEDVVRFLLSECKAKPARKDWEKVLNETQKEFNENRNW